MSEDTSPTATQPDVDIQDVSLVDNNIAPKQDAPSEPAEPGTEEAAAAEDKPQESEDTTTEGEQPPAEEAKPAENDAEATKRHNAQMAQKRIQEQQRTRQAVTKTIDETYAPKSEEDLIAEGMTAQQAQIQALREEMVFERQRTQIAELNATLQGDAVNVYNDFPVFNPEHKDYDPEFAQMVEEQYRTAARLQTDDRGIVLAAEVPLYDYYQRMNNIYNRGASKGTQQAQTDTLQMLSRTENVGGSSSTSGNSSNDLADLEERLGDVVIT